MGTENSSLFDESPCLFPGEIIAKKQKHIDHILI